MNPATNEKDEDENETENKRHGRKLPRAVGQTGREPACCSRTKLSKSSPLKHYNHGSGKLPANLAGLFGSSRVEASTSDPQDHTLNQKDAN